MIDRWIVIPGWDKFQHYHDRSPKWIKDYIEQLDRDEYLELTFAERGILQDIRKLYSRRSLTLPGNTRELSRVLGQRLSGKQLQRLVDAGYIEIVASKPVPKPYQPASTKRRVREDPQTPIEKKKIQTNGTTKKCPICGIGVSPPTTVADHLHLQHDVVTA